MSSDFDRTALARYFAYYAEHECREDPLYVALSRQVAASPPLLELMAHAPATQRIPNLLLAAVHERVLAGAPHALRAYFPSVGGERRPDAELAATFDDFVAQQRDVLCELLATRSTQTNEIGRCAVLWPVLCAIATRAQQPRLALLDFGCSAGLNLGVDHYRYDYGAFTLGAAAAEGVPTVACRLVGSSGKAVRSVAQAVPQLVVRTGVDPAPADVNDAAQLRWLSACVWPYDRERAQRFEQAVAIVRRERFDVRARADCMAAIEPWLDELPADVLPVVFNSWVLHYFDAASRQGYVAFMRELVQRRRIVWLSAEGAHVPVAHAGFEPPGDAEVPDEAVVKGSLWWLTTAGPDAPRAVLLARSHAHGRWVQWV